MKTILAIDGGGVRGLIPAMILEEIEKRTGLPISELFDVVAGSSTGGILASTISAHGESNKPKYTASDMAKFYKTLGKDVFKRTLWHKIKTGWGLWGSKYTSEGPIKLTKHLVGDVKVSEGLVDVVITTYDLQKAEPYIISSLNPQHSDVTLAEAVLGTTCVPGFFPPSKSIINDREVALVDGSVFAVDPSLSGYVEAYDGDEEVLLISLGTGETKLDINYDKCKKWGIIQWLFSLKGVQMIFDGLSDSTGSLVKTLVEKNGGKYYRVQVQVSPFMFVGFDSASDKSINKIETVAKKCIEDNNDLINDICRKLILAYANRKID